MSSQATAMGAGLHITAAITAAAAVYNKHMSGQMGTVLA